MTTPLISIVSGNHLCHNPRVIKEASALMSAGFQVEVLGAWFDSSLRARDESLAKKKGLRFVPVIDLAPDSNLSGAERFWCRLRSKLGQLAYTKLGCSNRWQLGHAICALSQAVTQSRASLFIAHSETALAAVSRCRASQSPPPGPGAEGGPAVSASLKGVDMEDWFSEDLPESARRNRPVKLLASFEQELLRAGAHSSCASHAISKALAEHFNCRPPTVVYNAFPWSERAALDGRAKDRKDCGIASLHWFSQTIGLGRGLEELFAALPMVKAPFEIHLRGKLIAGGDEWLAKQTPPGWASRVFIHPIVPNDELLSRIAEHDIGYAGELTYCRNKELTVSNKLLQYLLGGLAVAASDTPGQREIAQQAPGAFRLFAPGKPAELAEALNSLLLNREALLAAKADALRAAEQSFCWEKVAPNLVASVRNAMRLEDTTSRSR